MMTYQGDSGDQGEFVWEYVPVKHRKRQVITAVCTQSHRLKLISWQVTAEGVISRISDSGNQAGFAYDIDITSAGDFHVAACRNPVGKLALLTWRVSDAGLIWLQAEHVAKAIELDGSIKIGRLTDQLLVTAYRAKTGRLGLTAWRLQGDGSLQQLQDSTETAECVDEVQLIRMSNSTVVAVVRGENGRLRLMLWGVSANGRLVRVADSGLDGPVAGGIRAVRDEQGHIITSARNEHGRQQLTRWHIQANHITVVHTQTGKAMQLGDLRPQNDGIMSGVLTPTGDIQFTVWQVDEGGGLTAVADKIVQMEKATGLVFCQACLGGHLPLVTVFQTAQKRLKLTAHSDPIIA